MLFLCFRVIPAKVANAAGSDFMMDQGLEETETEKIHRPKADAHT